MFALRIGLGAAFLCIAAALAGCGSVRETLPAQSATEQLMLSTAADRCVEGLPQGAFERKTVFVDLANLECTNKAYVAERIRQAVLERGGMLAPNRNDAEVRLEVASGALSIDKRDYLLGIPALTVPVPLTSGSLALPELAIFKILSYEGKGKLTFAAVDTISEGEHVSIPVCYGRCRRTYWRFLLFGPFEINDLPKEAR